MSDTPTVPDSPAAAPAQTPTPLLSKKAAAARLGVAEKTIERYVHEYGLLVPAGEDPHTGAKLFDPADIERLRLAPPGRRKGGPDSRRQSDLALREIVTAMQHAHAETVRAKDETIAALREQLDSLRQSHQSLLSPPATDTDAPPAGQRQTPTVSRASLDQQETIATLRRRAAVAEAERDALRAAQAAPPPPGGEDVPQAGEDTPEATAGLWGRLGRWWRG